VEDAAIINKPYPGLVSVCSREWWVEPAKTSLWMEHAVFRSTRGKVPVYKEISFEDDAVFCGEGTYS